MGADLDLQHGGVVRAGEGSERLSAPGAALLTGGSGSSHYVRKSLRVRRLQLVALRTPKRNLLTTNDLRVQCDDPGGASWLLPIPMNLVLQQTAATMLVSGNLLSPSAAAAAELGRGTVKRSHIHEHGFSRIS